MKIVTFSDDISYLKGQHLCLLYSEVFELQPLHSTYKMTSH